MNSDKHEYLPTPQDYFEGGFNFFINKLLPSTPISVN